MDLTGALIPILCVIGVGLLVIVVAAVRIVAEYERGVIFRLGRVQGAKGPGLFFIIPYIDRMIKVDLRTVTLDVPSHYQRATWQIAQTSLRNVIGQSELDLLLQEREAINDKLQQIIDEATEPWGIKVSIVEVKDVELDQSMVRAMARQAEAERERRAKIIAAEGEFQAATQLTEAAEMMGRSPGAMTLRYLQTLTSIGVEQNTTTIFPVPLELFAAFLKTTQEEE